MSITKTVTGATASEDVRYQVSYTATPLPEENATRVSLLLSFYCDHGSRTGTLAYRVTLAGMSKSSEERYSMGSSATAFCNMDALVLPHDALGVANYTLCVRASMNGMAFDFTLPLEIAPISRISKLPALQDATLGEAYALRFTPLVSAFSHAFFLEVGTWSTTGVCQKDAVTGEETLTFTLPLSLAEQVPNGTVLSGTLTLQTLHDGVQIGADVGALVAHVPDVDALRPRVTASASAVGEFPDAFAGKFLQHLTPLSLAIEATPLYGATILTAEVRWEGTWREIALGGAELEAPTVSGARALHVRVRDSRGFVGERLLTISVHPTRAPRPVPVTGALQLVASREKDGVVGEQGTSLYLSFDGACTDLCDYTLQCRVRAASESDFGDWITLATNTAFSDTVTGLSLASSKSFVVELSVLDSLSQRGSVAFTIPCEDVCFHLRRGGEGAAFGKYAERQKTLEIAPDWTLRVGGTLDARATLYAREGGGLVAYREGGTRVRVAFSLPATFDGSRTSLAKDFLPSSALPSTLQRALAVCEGGACGVELTSTGELALTHLVGVSAPATLGFVEGEITYDLV